MREFWRKEGFIELHSPKLMGSASESGAELFKVEYFDRTAYLAQSPQFYKQMAMAAGFGKVFEVGPVFRANPSFTSRHDTEFTSVDVEISWIDSHEDVMAFEERWLAHVLARVEESTASRSQQTFDTEVVVPDAAVPAHHAGGRQGAAARARATRRRRRGHDLDPPSERALSAIVEERARPRVRVRDRLPDLGAALLPHAPRATGPTVTKSFDLLWRGIELTTGAQREHRYEQLLAQADDKKRRCRADPVLPRLLPLRRAAARRLRLRPDAPADADARAGERARGDVPVPRPAPAEAVGAGHLAASSSGRRDAALRRKRVSG